MPHVAPVLPGTDLAQISADSEKADGHIMQIAESYKIGDKSTAHSSQMVFACQLTELVCYMHINEPTDLRKLVSRSFLLYDGSNQN
jgi:hypothetical protein